jgi:coenzyme F420-reducing hydrogenase delta subunit
MQRGFLLVVGLLLCTSLGCGDGGAAVATKQRETLTEIHQLLTTINDGPSFAAAQPKLEAALGKLKQLDQEFDQLNLSTEQVYTLKTQSAETQKLAQQLAIESARLDQLSLPAAEREKLVQLFNTTQKTWK